MKWVAAFLLFSACGGPSMNQVIETPAATAPRRPAEAPPASQSDADRYRVNEQFEDMETTQEAYRQAAPETQGPPPPPPPKKKMGPAEQATMPKKPPPQPADAAPRPSTTP
jgi:hypothetical protein